MEWLFRYTEKRIEGVEVAVSFLISFFLLIVPFLRFVRLCSFYNAVPHAVYAVPGQDRSIIKRYSNRPSMMSREEASEGQETWG